MSEEKSGGTKWPKLSRRDFLRALGIGAVGAGAVAACEPESATIETNTYQGISATPVPVSNQYPEVPYAPEVAPAPETLVVFTPHEAQTVEALTATIMPGSPDDPGAREAGVTNFIDKMLAFNSGFAEPTYHEAPFAETYEGDTPPDQNDQKGGYNVIWVQKDQLERYGFQSILTPREMYRAGIKSVDRYANDQYGSDFVDLSADQQEQILVDMENGDAKDFDKPSAKDFFKLLRDHTIQGFFSDPAYGGNHEMVGWQLIGYPGAQRAYTPTDFHTEGSPRPPQSLLMMHRFHPGQPANASVIVPPSGAQEHPKE